MNANKEIFELLTKRLAEELSEAEKLKVWRWLSENPDNKKDFDSLPDCFKVKEYIDFVKNIDVDRDLEQVKRKISIRKQFLRRRFIAVASTLIILISLGGTLLFRSVKSPLEQHTLVVKSDSLQEQNINARLICDEHRSVLLTDALVALPQLEEYYLTTHRKKIEVLKDRKFNFTLPDGTHVFLNSESSIEFPDYFNGNRREVWVKGEAYFIVAKNKKKPFVVHSDLMDIVATGTQFNIKSCPKKEEAEAILFEGGIDLFYGEKKKQMVRVKPKEQVIVKKDVRCIELKQINSNTYIFWFKD